MKRFMMTFVALATLGVFAGNASAQYPPPPSKNGLLQAGGYAPGPVASPYAVPVYGIDPASEEPDTSGRYGLHPVLKRLFHIKDAGCGKDGCGKEGCAKGGKGHAAPVGHPGFAGPPSNPATGGTLAFPQHPYVRSPRDFFMMDQ